MEDLYQLLTVSRDASQAEIKKAYRKLARKYHPDVNPGNKESEEQFRLITRAYNILSDPKKREQYDRFGVVSEAGQQAGFDPSNVDFHFEGFEFGGFDFSQGSFGSFRDLFEDFVGGRRRRSAHAADATQPRHGEDIQHSITLSFMDALQGLIVKVQIHRMRACDGCDGGGRIKTSQRRICPHCDGRGERVIAKGPIRFASTCPACAGRGEQIGEACRECSGEGRVEHKERVRVRIPAGVANGSRVRIPKKGNAGRNGGQSGDLYILTRVEEHPIFRRKGDNLYCRVPITVTEAALGSKIDVPTPYGMSKVRLPPGTQSGQQFRLRARGAPSLRGNTKGDLYVLVEIQIPHVSDQRSRELFEELAELDPHNPRQELYKMQQEAVR